MYKRKQTFEHLVALQVITGHRYAYEIDKPDLAPIARAWVLERASILDGELFALLPNVFSGWQTSAMSQVMDCTPFNAAVNGLLRRGMDTEPCVLTRRLAQGIEPAIPVCNTGPMAAWAQPGGAA